jgi:hypothetical protein
MVLPSQERLSFLPPLIIEQSAKKTVSSMFVDTSARFFTPSSEHDITIFP